MFRLYSEKGSTTNLPYSQAKVLKINFYLTFIIRLNKLFLF
jgi:hypothetical protein